MQPRRKSTEIDWLDAAMDGDDFPLRAMGTPQVTPHAEPASPAIWHDIVTIAAGALVIGLVVLAVFNIPIWSN